MEGIQRPSGVALRIVVANRSVRVGGGVGVPTRVHIYGRYLELRRDQGLGDQGPGLQRLHRIFKNKEPRWICRLL